MVRHISKVEIGVSLSTSTSCGCLDIEESLPDAMASLNMTTLTSTLASQVLSTAQMTQFMTLKEISEQQVADGKAKQQLVENHRELVIDPSMLQIRGSHNERMRDRKMGEGANASVYRGMLVRSTYVKLSKKGSKKFDEYKNGRKQYKKAREACLRRHGPVDDIDSYPEFLQSLPPALVRKLPSSGVLRPK